MNTLLVVITILLIALGGAVTWRMATQRAERTRLGTLQDRANDVLDQQATTRVEVAEEDRLRAEAELVRAGLPPEDAAKSVQALLDVFTTPAPTEDVTYDGHGAPIVREWRHGGRCPWCGGHTVIADGRLLRCIAPDCRRSNA